MPQIETMEDHLIVTLGNSNVLHLFMNTKIKKGLIKKNKKYKLTYQHKGQLLYFSKARELLLIEEMSEGFNVLNVFDLKDMAEQEK